VKSRKWILYAAALGLILGLGIWQAKERLRIDALFNTYLTREVFHATRQQVTIRETSVQPGRLKVRGVTLVPSDTREEVRIEQLDITYSLAKLIVTGFNFGRAVDRIVIQRPEVRLAPQADSSLIVRIRRALQRTPDQGRGQLPYGRIIISQGAVFLEDTSHVYQPACTHIQGHYDFQDQNRSTLQLEAHCLATDDTTAPNLTIRGTFDRGADTYDLTIAVRQARLDPTLPLDAFYRPVHSLDARVDINLSFQKQDGRHRAENTGIINVEAATVNLAAGGPALKDVTCRGTFDTTGVVFRAQARYGATRLNGHGVIGYEHEMQVAAQLVVENAGPELLALVNRTAPGRIRLGGNRLVATLRGPLARPEVNGTFTTGQAACDVFTVTGVHGQFSYRDSVMNFIVAAVNPGVRTLSSQGTVDWSGRRRTVALEALCHEDDLTQMARRFLPMAVGGTGDIHLTLTGPGDSLTSTGTFSLKNFSLGSYFKTDALDGSYGYQNGTVTFASQTQKRNYHIEGQVGAGRDSLNIYAKVRCNALPLDTLARDCGLKLRHLPGQVNAVVEVMGQGRRFTVKGRGLVEGNPLLSGGLVVTGAIGQDAREQITADMTVSAADLRVRRQPLPVEAVLALRDRVLSVSSLAIGDFVEDGSGTIPLDGVRELNGKIAFSRMSAARVAAWVAPGAETLVTAGTLNGTVKLAGTSRAPLVTIDVSLLDGVIRNVTTISAILSVSATREKMSIGTLKLYHGKRQLADGSGEVVYGKTWEGTLRGDQIAARDLADLAPQPPALSGVLAYRCRLSGSPAAPQVQGEVTILNGQIAAIPFSRLEAKVAWTRAALEIKSFKLAQGLEYALDGYGTLSARVLGLAGPPADGASQLAINATGNLFKLVPSSIFFEKAFCYGKAALQIGEQDGRLVLSDFSMLLSNGEIRVAAYPAPVTDINGSFRFDKQKRLLKIERMYATLDGNRFSVNNQDELVLRDKILVPFTIAQLDIKLGVFSISMARRITPFYVPGLLAKGQRADLEVRGRQPGELFYLAGPNATPTLRGELGVNEADFTYPFIMDKKSKGSFALLRKLNWDLRVVPEKNVRYYSDFADLELNEEGSLDIQGSLERKDFYIEGRLTSNDGQLSYLGEDFDVAEAGVEFDRYNILPVIYGEGRKVTEFTNQTKEMLLRICAEDRLTGKRDFRPRWNKFKFKIFSESGDEADSLLFVGDSTYQVAGPKVTGAMFNSFILRPMLRPMERRLERWTGDFSNFLRMKNVLRLDMIRLDPGLGRTMFDGTGAYDLVRRSQFTLGKSVYDNMFFTYTGMVDTVSATDGSAPGLGLAEHRLGLQVKLLQNLRVDYEYRIENDEARNKQDVRLKYFFYFE
jgi:hypothetical protein